MASRVKFELTDNAFWRFSTDVYRHPPVAELLLQAQSKWQANVNLALLCVYLDQHNRALSREQMANLHNTLQQFSREFTMPLRQLRQHYKSQQQTLNHYTQLRQHLLDAELLFERQEQSLLIELCNNMMLVNQPQTNNVHLYMTVLKENRDAPVGDESIAVDLCDLNQWLVTQ